MTINPTKMQQGLLDRLLSKDTHDMATIPFFADRGGGKTMAACLAAFTVRTRWPNAHIIIVSKYRWLKAQYEQEFGKNDRHLHWVSPGDLDPIRSTDAGLVVVDDVSLDNRDEIILFSRLRKPPQALIRTYPAYRLTRQEAAL